MPVDPTAKKRAVIWYYVVVALIVALPSLYFWDWRPALLLPLIVFLSWPVPAAYEKKRSVDELKLKFREVFEERDRPDAFPVMISVTSGNWFIGHDIGMLRYDNHRLIFEGLRTEFDVHRRDVTDGVDDNSIAVMSESREASDLNFRIDLAWPQGVPESSRRGDLYLKDRDNFWRSAKTKSGESILPPKMPFSGEELKPHRLIEKILFAYFAGALIRIPVRVAGLPWSIDLAVSITTWTLAMFGVWLYLNRAYPKALARIGSQERRRTNLTVAEN
jgi:hypothetical protein